MRTERERSAFGQRMYEARKASGLTQVEVQTALGISQSNMSDLEGTAESSTFVPQLAELYKVDAHWLATGEGSREVIRIDGQHRLFGVLKDMDLSPVIVEEAHRSQVKALRDAVMHGEMKLGPDELALILAYRELALPEQREAATAPLFAKAEEARKMREHYERLTGKKVEDHKPDRELEHLRAPAHEPPAPRGVKSIGADTSGKGKQSGHMRGGRSQFGDLGAPEVKKGKK